MAGHSKFKNIQHRKNAQDKKRAKLFTRVVREIITAAKSGANDPEHNARLRSAIIAARAVNLPKDRIDKAISQADSAGEDFNYIDIRYEGFLPGGIAVIVEASTNNRNRTASEVRSVFTKFGGQLEETGKLSFMFDKFGVIEYEAEIANEDAFVEVAIEAGAIDCVSNEDSHIIYTAVEEFNKILEIVTKKFEAPTDAYIGWKPQNIIPIESAEKEEKIQRMVDALEDFDDVQRVFTNSSVTN